MLFCFIALASAVMARNSLLESKLKRQDSIEKPVSLKKLNLSNQMIKAYIADNEKSIDYNTLAYAPELPLNMVQSGAYRKGKKPTTPSLSVAALSESSEDNELLSSKANKGPGVEDRWRMRLTNCQKTQTCQCGSEIVTGPMVEGVIESQSGELYAPNSNCLWTIEAPADYTILARFDKFAVEREDVCGFDYVMLFTGQMAYLQQQSHNNTVKSEGVYCGSIKYPQNVGNDDWSDKTNLIPTADSGDDTLNRTMFNGQWVDLQSRYAGVVMVTDSNTQHGGFSLQYKTVPKVNIALNVTTAYDMLAYIHERMLEHTRTNPLNTPELILLQEHHVNKTISRLQKATTKGCYNLKDNRIPTKIQEQVKKTKTITGYFDPLLDFVVVTHKKCRTKHRYAWRKRFNKLGNFISEATASIQIQRKINRHRQRGVGYFSLQH